MRTDMLDVYPHRGAGEKFLLYTESEMGEFHAIAFDEEGYLDLVRNGTFSYSTGDYVHIIRPTYALLVVGVDGFDFHFRRIREQQQERT